MSDGDGRFRSVLSVELLDELESRGIDADVHGELRPTGRAKRRWITTLIVTVTVWIPLAIVLWRWALG